jgi:hypothetical protein
MKTITEIITSYNPKSIYWYPSAGLDIQIIDTYLKHAEKLDAIQPEFYIFSDTGYWINNDGEIRINRDNGSNLIDTNDFISRETFSHINNLAISKDYIGYWSTWEDFKEHKDILPIDRKDDPFEELGITDLLFPEEYEEEEEKQHVCNQFMEKLSNTGVVFKKDNVHVLFLAVDNTEIYNLLERNTEINSLIYNRPKWTFPADGLKKLKVSEICSGGTGPGMRYLQDDENYGIIGNQFKWRGDDHINRNVGNILRVIN